MPVTRNHDLETFQLPGITHRTLAGPAQGVQRMEVWMQTLERGAATPVHRHDCEEVIVVLSGSGRCVIENEPLDFGPDSTLVVPRNAVHQLINTSGEEICLIAALDMARVRVRTEDGSPLRVPWEAE